MSLVLIIKDHDLVRKLNARALREKFDRNAVANAILAVALEDEPVTLDRSPRAPVTRTPSATERRASEILFMLKDAPNGLTASGIMTVLGVSKITARNAITLLLNEGSIVREQGANSPGTVGYPPFVYRLPDGGA